MEFLKYIVILVAAPIWLPFAKELWGEFLLAMRADGGLVKPPPGPVERKRIAEDLDRNASLYGLHEVFVADGVA